MRKALLVFMVKSLANRLAQKSLNLRAALCANAKRELNTVQTFRIAYIFFERVSINQVADSSHSSKTKLMPRAIYNILKSVFSTKSQKSALNLIRIQDEQKKIYPIYTEVNCLYLCYRWKGDSKSSPYNEQQNIKQTNGCIFVDCVNEYLTQSR